MTVYRFRVVPLLLATTLCLAAGVREAVAAETAANDCLVAIQNGQGQSLATDQTCTDGDPNCDADGAADGTCTFTIRGAVNVPDAACTPRPIKKVKFAAPHSQDKVVVTPIAGQADSAFGAFIGFHVPLKKKGTKPGSRILKAMAQADVKPRGKNKDKDKVKFTCNPCVGDTCSADRCPTTCTNTAGGPNRLVLTIASDAWPRDSTPI